VGDTEQVAVRRPTGRDISVVVGALSLIVAVGFSAIQARDSARSIDQSQRSLALQQQANNFQTLISVSSTLQRSRAQLDQIVSGGKQRPSALLEALRPNESIAFALNRKLVAIPGAEMLWGNLLYCNWRLAQSSVFRGRFPPYFPETVRYVRTYQRSRSDRRWL
jgi:hypothetical protein